jgi:hypothetical protein
MSAKPRNPKIKSLATRVWYQLLKRAKKAETNYQLEHALGLPAGRLLRYERGENYPGKAMLAIGDAACPHARFELESPTWCLLEAPRPEAYWARAAGFLYQSMVRRMEAIDKGDDGALAEAFQGWIKFGSKIEGVDRLFYFAGPCMAMMRRGDRLLSRVAIEAMVAAIHRLDTSYGRMLPVPEIFGACRRKIWVGSIADEYLDGYDFNRARLCPEHRGYRFDSDRFRSRLPGQITLMRDLSLAVGIHAYGEAMKNVVADIGDLRRIVLSEDS